MDSNEQLYQGFLNGDEQCLHQLMERFGDALTWYVYGYVHSLEDAEDIMIEAFSYLVVKRPRIHEQGLKAYLYKTARHMALRVKEKRSKVFSFDLEDFHHLADETPAMEALVTSREQRDALHSCMALLTPEYREALYLVYFEGMSYKQAGKIMHKREKQVADYIYRGKKSLKIKLEKEGITNA